VLSVRPKIAELVFQLYGRSLHPELFEVHNSRQVERGGYRANVQITTAGHVITWQYQGITLTEVAAAANHPLPERRRLMSHRLKGTCTDEVECRAADKPVAKATFDMALNPPEVAVGDIRVKALRIFPVADQLPAISARQYANALPADSTTRIGIELEFSHAPLGHAAKLPVDCWFFWPDGQTSPPLVLSYEPQPTWAGGYSAGAMGFETPGSWTKGTYTVSCSIQGQPAGVERFEID